MLYIDQGLVSVDQEQGWRDAALQKRVMALNEDFSDWKIREIERGIRKIFERELQKTNNFDDAMSNLDEILSKILEN